MLLFSMHFGLQNILLCILSNAIWWSCKFIFQPHLPGQTIRFQNPPSSLENLYIFLQLNHSGISTICVIGALRFCEQVQHFSEQNAFYLRKIVGKLLNLHRCIPKHRKNKSITLQYNYHIIPPLSDTEGTKSPGDQIE